MRTARPDQDDGFAAQVPAQLGEELDEASGVVAAGLRLEDQLGAGAVGSVGQDRPSTSGSRRTGAAVPVCARAVPRYRGLPAGGRIAFVLEADPGAAPRARRDDTVPADPADAPITTSRLRRTLAWFIARRPRGLVAAAIQYGHVSVKMTLGYSGSYASGFPDDLAFEEWLTRHETMADAHQRLTDGEHVSGPTADTFRTRVTAATRFAGRTLRTNREAATLLANPTCTSPAKT